MLSVSEERMMDLLASWKLRYGGIGIEHRTEQPRFANTSFGHWAGKASPFDALNRYKRANNSQSEVHLTHHSFEYEVGLAHLERLVAFQGASKAHLNSATSALPKEGACSKF